MYTLNECVLAGQAVDLGTTRLYELVHVDGCMVMSDAEIEAESIRRNGTLAPLAAYCQSAIARLHECADYDSRVPNNVFAVCGKLAAGAFAAKFGRPAL